MKHSNAHLAAIVTVLAISIFAGIVCYINSLITDKIDTNLFFFVFVFSLAIDYYTNKYERNDTY